MFATVIEIPVLASPNQAKLGLMRSEGISRSATTGDHLVKLSAGRIVEAAINSIVDTTDGVRLQASFGDETALISQERAKGPGARLVPTGARN
jgi:hypothetical protein